MTAIRTADRNRVIVVGSSNMDLVIRVPRLPLPGETLAGRDFGSIPGGKGANQAVAAARLGAQVSFVSCIGDDGYGKTLLAGFADDGIDTARVRVSPRAPTGVALITVSDEGTNTIVVAPGANAELRADDVQASEPAIAQAAVVLCQLETPLETVTAAIELARRHGARAVLNPAPATPLPPELLRQVDFLVPNETEASLLAGMPVADLASAHQAAEALRALGAAQILVTLGAQGVWWQGADGGRHFPAPRVRAVDTTAAGDTFIGGFAAALASGADVPTAIEFGQRAAALSVTRPDAQSSIPRLAEIMAGAEK